MRGWVLLCCLLAVAAGAETITLAPPQTRIAPGQTEALNFGTVPQKDTTVLLTLRSRVDLKTLGGSNFMMALKLNGHELAPAKSRSVVRLLNRPLVSPVAPNVPAPWYGSGAGWRVLYSPDFEAGLKQGFYVGNPYELVLDITDLTNPMAENRLEIRNVVTPGLAKQLNAPLDLILGELTITTKPGASPTMNAADSVQHRINRGEPGAGPAAYRGEVLPGGGFALTIEGQRLAFATSLSYPNAGFNQLVAGAPVKGQAGWAVTGCTVTATGGEVTAAGPDYTLRRVIAFTPRKVSVRDTLTNRHADAKLGLAVRDELLLAGVPQPAVRIAGNGDPAYSQGYAPSNPSVHVAFGERSVGLVCEDDVLRNQAALYYDAQANAAGLRTEMLCLQPGETRTLEWSVYPVASPEYYDFINLLRADWDSNYTTEGAWCFFGPDPVLDAPDATLKANLDRLGIQYACSWGGWVDGKHDKKRIGFGTEVASDYWADYRDRLKRATAKLHQLRPGIKVLIYYDTQRDTHTDAPKRYPDSLLTNAEKQPLSTDWSGIYSLTWSMVATTDNSYGKGMLDLIDVYMDQLGADGLYWDEMENVGYDSPLITYSQPDGHTCQLDPKTWTIQRELGITTLLGEGHRLAVIDKVRRKGGTLMGNGPATTKAILGRHVQRMIEIQHNNYWCYQGQLESPIGYGSSEPEFSNVLRALGFGMLVVGTRWDYPHEMSKYEFPFTPIELHSGYLLGRERIITMHSGRYGWPGETVPVTVRIFDAKGKLKSTADATAGPGRLPVELGEGEAAVISRR